MMGTAYSPMAVIMAPFWSALAGIIKLRGMPVLLFTSTFYKNKNSEQKKNKNKKYKKNIHYWLGNVLCSDQVCHNGNKCNSVEVVLEDLCLERI